MKSNGNVISVVQEAIISGVVILIMVLPKLTFFFQEMILCADQLVKYYSKIFGTILEVWL